MCYIKKIIKLFFTIGIILVVPVVYSQQTEFYERIQNLTGILLENLLKQEDIKTKKVIILAQLLFEPTGEFIVLKHTDKNGYVKKLEVVIGDNINNSKYFSVQQMSENGLKSFPDYIMRGSLKLDNDNYRIYYSITNKETGKILATDNVLIPINSSLSLEQYLVYEGKSWGNKDLASIHKIKFGYGQSLERTIQKNQKLYDCYLFEGIIQDALDNYQKGNYKSALELFTRASECKEEQKIISHLGLAQCYKKLGQLDNSEKSQKRIAEIATFRKGFDIYFTHDSSDLNEDAKNILRAVGRIIKQNISSTNKCYYNIIGHTDTSGTDEHNDYLSTKRANEVRDFLIRHFPELKKNVKEVIGHGSDECNMCNIDGLDKSQDRRVEFEIVDCK